MNKKQTPKCAGLFINNFKQCLPPCPSPLPQMQLFRTEKYKFKGEVGADFSILLLLLFIKQVLCEGKNMSHIEGINNNIIIYIQTQRNVCLSLKYFSALSTLIFLKI